IGSVAVRGPLALASMEEHTSLPFRLLAREFGADLVVTEMVEPDRLVAGDTRARRMLATVPAERPAGGQLLAGDPDATAAAAKIVESLEFAFVDINFGCPIRRVLAREWGGSYLRNPRAVTELLETVTAAVTIPVTAKLRAGWESADDAASLAAAAERGGAAAVTLHARTILQAYRGPADWSAIKRAREACRIPVIGNGGIRVAADAARMLAETGCAAVSIARGALGNPWIFREAKALLAGAPAPAIPSREEHLKILLRHLDAEAKFLGTRRISARLVRLALYYAKDLPDFPDIRMAARRARGVEDLARVMREAFRNAG
ncbi:MAG: tRNA-dihydrouridine synthase family protein, partial [Planctomycetota bacterium]